MDKLFEQMLGFMKGEAIKEGEIVVAPLDNDYLMDPETEEIIVYNDLVSSNDNDELPVEDIVMDKECNCECEIAKVAYAAVCFANDMKHIHLHAAGPQFDNIHDTAEEYYKKASEDIDLLFEFALENNEKVCNPTNAANIIGWVPSCEDVYGYEDAVDAIEQCLEAYLYLLNGIQDCVSDHMKSEIDSMIQFWSKELDYKLKRRSIDSHNMVLSENYDYGEYHVQITQDGTIIRDMDGNFIMQFPTEEEALKFIDEELI